MSKKRQSSGPAHGGTKTRCFKSLSGLTHPKQSAPLRRRQTLWQRMKKQCSPAPPDEASRRSWRNTFHRSSTVFKGRNKRLQKRPRSPIARTLRSQLSPSSEGMSELKPAAASTVSRSQAMGSQPEADPTPDTNVKKRHSIFGISGLLQAVSFEVEKSFLTPVEKRILQNIHIVSGEGRFQSSSTSSEPARLFMPDEDSSEALQAIQALTRHYSIHDKEILCRDLDRLLTREQRKMLRKTLYSDVEICCRQSNRFLSPPAHPREDAARLRICQGPVRAVTFAEASQRPPPRNALHDATPQAGEIVIRHDIEISRDSSCLRGGGGKETSGTTFNILDLGRRPKPLKDDQRPHPAIWWLAGGRLNPKKPGLGVPTASTLRERRVVEEANREKVGFLGTLVRLRRVEVTRRQLREACKPLLTGHKDGTAADSGEAGQGAKEQAASVVPEAPGICGAAGSTEGGAQGKE